MSLLSFPIYKLIILFLTIFLAGLVDSIAGGGGILSIPAYLFLGLPGHIVLGTNKFSSSIGTLFATLRFAISKKINWIIGIISVIFALIGSTIGSRLVLLIPVNFIKILLIILIPIITIITLIPKKQDDKNSQIQDYKGNDKITKIFEYKLNNKTTEISYSENLNAETINAKILNSDTLNAENLNAKNLNTDASNNNKYKYKLEKIWLNINKKFLYYFIAASASLVIGMYDGFFGPGTGTFFILVYTSLLHFDMTTASANAKVVNLSSNIAALITFLLYKKVFILLGIICAAFSITGNLLGSSLAIKKGSKVIRPFFILALLLLFSKVVYDLFIFR
ncbi:MAG TPA: TSUP family transporter [Exilispira sp.]|nr:TSUP family transporter [Exilispira sp.]